MSDPYTIIYNNCPGAADGDNEGCKSPPLESYVDRRRLLVHQSRVGRLPGRVGVSVRVLWRNRSWAERTADLRKGGLGNNAIVRKPRCESGDSHGLVELREADFISVDKSHMQQHVEIFPPSKTHSHQPLARGPRPSHPVHLIPLPPPTTGLGVWCSSGVRRRVRRNVELAHYLKAL